MGPRQHTAGMLVLAMLPPLILAGCPFQGMMGGAPATLEVPAARSLLQKSTPQTVNIKAVEALDIKAVKADLTKLLTDSQDFWPGDFGGHYGGLFIRQAWHCSGGYRTWDGRGGCDGARQRFEPEVSWPDNTNLDKAKKLLEPIKEKYGDALSWGDLIVLAGDTSIEAMGGPKLPFCAGRIDDKDGEASMALGPTAYQKLVLPCTQGDGMCEQPLGQTTMGLIYVNPEGVMAQPIPEKSVEQIRGTFGRMSMNDLETVALIGGGHAFGKAHGACPTGAGPGPEVDPKNPWPGTCGSGPMKGKGNNTFTSGLEGKWTTTPTEWSNEYFNNLLNFDWVVHKGPGGHFQWKPKHKGDKAGSTEDLPNIMMFTTDLALLKDPSYLKAVQYFASNLTALTEEFGKAWYKLVTRDIGPITRCLGKEVAPAQPWQMPLPDPPANQPDFTKVRADVVKALAAAPANGLPTDTAAGKPWLGALLSTLAYQCASTFRATDYQGGCNGARIRFSPIKDWSVNKGLDKVIAALAPIKEKYPTLSWADLIVLAGTVANEQAAGAPGSYKFCPGRADAKDAKGTEHLAPRNYTTQAIKVRDNMKVAGLTPSEGVVLAGRPRSPAYMKAQGYGDKEWGNPKELSNAYFKTLTGNEWEKVKLPNGKDVYKAKGKEIYMLPSDIAIRDDPEFGTIAKEFASDNGKFLGEFQAAWTKMMNADRFKGPAGNVCDAS